MAETPSIMIPLGTKAPHFLLQDSSSGQLLSLQDIKSEIATVVMFLCNHCPYVKYIHSQLLDVVKKYQAKGISFVAINANDAKSYPADSPTKMREEALKHHYTFPYLYDETQQVAKAYHAACTPDFFVFDKALLCVYRGRFDDATPGNYHTVTGKDLCEALDDVLLGKPLNNNQKPSVGCNIKWKKELVES